MSDRERIHVLIVESGRTVGGTERVVWELATRLSRERYQVAAWIAPAPAMDELAAALAERGVAVDRVAEVDSRWDWKGFYGTWQRLRRTRPDILHVHHVWPAADRYLASIAGAAGVRRLIVTEHIVGSSHSAAQRSLKRGELDRAEAVTAVCGAVADSVSRDYGFPRVLVKVVPNGTDPPDEDTELPEARAARQHFGASRQRPLWVCAARLEEQKGHDVLLEAAAELRRRGLVFTLALAGEGSLLSALEQQCEEAGLSEFVQFLGRVDEIGPLLLAADAVILPSRWEGLPLSLLEALARGRPVVASRVGGIPEVIVDGVTGRLVPPGDAAALADVLESFHREPEEAARLGEAGAEEVLARFTWDHMVQSFEALYDQALGLDTFEPGRPRSGAGA